MLLGISPFLTLFDLQIENEQPQVIVPQKATLSPVPFAEPTWLSKGYYTPYYNVSSFSIYKNKPSDPLIWYTGRPSQVPEGNAIFLRYLR